MQTRHINVLFKNKYKNLMYRNKINRQKTKYHLPIIKKGRMPQIQHTSVRTIADRQNSTAGACTLPPSASK